MHTSKSKIGEKLLKNATLKLNRQGNFFVVAAPSGAGKTSLVTALVSSVDQLKISISHTTRPPRPADVEGRDYYFVSTKQFKQMIKARKFIEYAKIYGHYYGTSREWIEEQLFQGGNVLLEIDWQGAQQIRQQYPKAVLIFILPPSTEALLKRLQNRQQDNTQAIALRMAAAKEEIQHYTEFDYLIINDDFQQALLDLKTIIQAEQLRCTIQAQKYADLLAELLKR